MNRLLDGYDLRFPNGTGTDEGEAHEVVVEQTDVQTRIAEAIADLSGTDSVPAGFAEDRSLIEADEIEFADGGWRTQLAQVADWLHLDGDLDETSADAFDDSLAVELASASGRTGGRGLRPRPTSRCFSRSLNASTVRWICVTSSLRRSRRSTRTQRRSRPRPRCGRPGGTRS